MKLKKALFKAACLLPDKAYLQLAYYIIFRKFLNLKNPVTFNEKLQWLKLYDHNPRYTRLVDKVEVKREVARIIGNEYIIPTLGVWDNASDIDFDSLPNQFVLKTNHSGGSSGVIICRDKATFDKEDAVKKLNHSLKTDAYLYGREWPYKNVRRKILAEELLEDKTSYDLKDYKFFCFDGKVEFLKVDFNRFENHQANYLTPEWSVLPFGEKICPPDYDKTIEKPENFNEMLALAEKVAKDIPFARVDFYNVTGRTYFGEITFYPASGFGTFTSQEADKEIGRMLKLSNRGGTSLILNNI